MKPQGVLFYSDSLLKVADFGCLLGYSRCGEECDVYCYGMLVMEMMGKGEH